MDQRDKQNLAAILVIALLAVGGYWLLAAMKQHAAIEDCLLQHRTNCDALIDH